MSHSANQFDNSYKPSRLGNWEVPATRRAPAVARGPGGTTQIIVDDKGHLLPGKSTKGKSFPDVAPGEIPSYRWPDNMGSSAHKYGGGATMGCALRPRALAPSPSREGKRRRDWERASALNAERGSPRAASPSQVQGRGDPLFANRFRVRKAGAGDARVPVRPARLNVTVLSRA